MEDIQKLKQKLRDGYTLADQPIQIHVSGSLDPTQIQQICHDNHKEGDGVVVRMKDVIDNYPSFIKRLKSYVGFNYNLGDPQQDDFPFLLMDGSIGDIYSQMNKTKQLAATLAIPHVKRVNMPYDHIVPEKVPYYVQKTEKVKGRDVFITDEKGDPVMILKGYKHSGIEYRKLIDYSQPFRVYNGHPHMAIHTMSDLQTNHEYPLIAQNSQLNPKMMFGDKNVIGTGGIMNSTYDNAMLHSYGINNSAVYPSGHEALSRVEVLSADQGGVNTQHLVCIPNNVFMSSWYDNMDQYHVPEGKMVPLTEWSRAMFLFLDGTNQTRSTTFDNLATVFSGKLHPNTQNLNMTYKFRILPIVPKHPKGAKEDVPAFNYEKFCMGQLRHAKERFE